MQYIDKLIARNLNGFPEPNAQESLMERRCYYFTKGVLVFRPYLDCSGCASSFSLEDINPFAICSDPSETRVICPGCSTKGQMKLKVMAMESESAPGLTVVCERDLLKCDLEKELPKDAKATDFGEEVHYLFRHQLEYRLAKFMLAQPLLLMTKIELIKHQPTLAYNLELFEGFESMMRDITLKFLRVSKEEASKTTQTSISIGEILPSDVHLPDELEPVEQKEEAPAKDCKNCNHAAEAHYSGCMLCEDHLCGSKPKELTTYVWKNCYVTNSVEFHTYKGIRLIRFGGLYIENPSTDKIKASLVKHMEASPCEKHLLVLTTSLFQELEMPNSRVFTTSDRWAFGDLLEGDDKHCHYCTAPFGPGLTICSQCDFVHAVEEAGKKEKLQEFIKRQEAEAKTTLEKQMEQLSIKEEEDNSDIDEVVIRDQRVFDEYVESHKEELEPWQWVGIIDGEARVFSSYTEAQQYRPEERKDKNWVCLPATHRSSGVVPSLELGQEDIQDYTVMYVRRKDKTGKWKTLPMDEADKLTDIPEE